MVEAGPKDQATADANGKTAARRTRTSSKKKPEPPTTLLMVRHGKTPTTGKLLPGRAPGLHLSDEGRSDAATIAARLFDAHPKPVAIYCSPMERAVETASPYAVLTGIEPVQNRAIIECDFGEWTGRELSELSKLDQWRTVQQRPSLFRFPGGESFVEMSDRMRSFMLEMEERHKGQVVVAFSHADPIKALVADCLGMHLDQFQRIVISTTSVSILSIDHGVPYVAGVNITASITKGTN